MSDYFLSLICAGSRLQVLTVNKETNKLSSYFLRQMHYFEVKNWWWLTNLGKWLEPNNWDEVVLSKNVLSNFCPKQANELIGAFVFWIIEFFIAVLT